MANLVKMIRDLPEYKGGPTTADIAAESVADAKFHGWKEAVAKPTPEKKAKPTPEKKAEPAKDNKSPIAAKDKKVK